jgi:hypothetical protein
MNLSTLHMIAKPLGSARTVAMAVYCQNHGISG